MSERPYVSFAEVKERVPLPDVLKIFGLVDEFSRKGDRLTGVCPLPAHQHGPRPNPDQFKISRRDGTWLWYCFGDCNRGGDVIDFVKAMTGYDNAHVRFWFAEHFGDRLSLKKPKEPEPREKEKARDAGGDRASQATCCEAPINLANEPSELKPLTFKLQLDPAAPYLKERGLTDETIKRYGLGLCKRGVLKGYVAIPVYRWPGEAGDNPVGYLGRWPGEDYDESKGRPRYKFPDGFPRNQVIYGLREALEGTEGRPLIVVEGPFKVCHLVQSGFPATVATLGSSMSDEQAKILVQTGRHILLLFDGDEAGRSGMEEAAHKLISQTLVRLVKLGENVEPDNLATDELKRLLQ